MATKRGSKPSVFTAFNQLRVAGDVDSDDGSAEERQQERKEKQKQKKKSRSKKKNRHVEWMQRGPIGVVTSVAAAIAIGAIAAAGAAMTSFWWLSECADGCLFVWTAATRRSSRTWRSCRCQSLRRARRRYRCQRRRGLSRLRMCQWTRNRLQVVTVTRRSNRKRFYNR